MKFQDFTKKVFAEIKEEVEEIEEEVDMLMGKEPPLINKEKDGSPDVNKDKTITLGQPSGE